MIEVMFSAKTKGFTCGIIACRHLRMNPLFTLPLYEEGLNADSVLFYRYGLAIVLLALFDEVEGRVRSGCRRRKLFLWYLPG